jgi:polyamine oxidase
MMQNDKTLILGAGLAGLSAAAELKRRGADFLVLEARDRVGGRLWTDRTAGGARELGAQVLHGVSANPLARRARALRMKGLWSDYGDYRVYEDGKALPEKDVEKAQKLFSDLMARAVEKHGGRDASVLAAMKKEGLARAFRGNERLLDWFLASASIYSGAELDTLSVRFFEDEEEYDRPALYLPGGLDTLVADLLKRVGPGHVLLGHPVECVDWSKKTVRVFARGRVFEAARVLVTLPAGVLKKGGPRFVPALPKTKRKAIRDIGFGVLDLVYLEFERVFWPAEPSFIGISGEKHFARFLNRWKWTRQPVLVGSLGAGAARHMEKMPDARVVSLAMEALKRVFPKAPRPVASRVTRWSQDPFARGSYSNLAVGSGADVRRRLAEPAGGRLFFAGEATHEEHAGTLHGAYFSGLREASRILKEIR